MKKPAKPAPKVTLESFVSKMLPLLELEKEAEIAASTETIGMTNPDVLQQRGSALKGLKCVGVEAGLLGKSLLLLQPNSGELLPSHKLSTHDVVLLKPNKGGSAAESLGQGVVYRIKDKSITVAMDDVPDEGVNSLLRLEKVANEVTYQRLKSTLLDLGKGVSRGPATDLVPVLFGEKPPSFSKTHATYEPYNTELDESQVKAVKMALSAQDVMLLHGPPGTGKTTAVVEIILQEVKRGLKVLACASSNIAVDNMVERLACHKVKVVRLGHPARLLPQVLDCALDAQVLKTDNSSLAKDIRKEISVLNAKILKAKDRKSRDELRRELRQLSKEERQRQQKAVTDVIQGASVVLTTLTGAMSAQLQKVDFDVVVLDEAAQALETACWIAILKGRRCLLAGDHLQLAPTVLSKEAEKQGFGTTLFERLAGLYASQAMTMLTVQYRMHEHIMDWSSHELYGGKIQAHELVASRKLFELDGVKKTPATEHTLVLIDICGCDMEESKDETESSFNEGEARIAITHAQKLVESGVKAIDIGIVTPYAAQVNVLRRMRNEEQRLLEVEISTIDGFQGREKEAMIISMVRSNDKKEVGFLSDKRRMNVAVTRAKRQCCVICDSDTVGKDPFLKRLLDYFEKHGEYCYGLYYQ
ncbi:hypothetical protein SELMODRAFT_179218 [Selaginella moellendorffii]|uniref:DNA helicase n=2 Tax=Selaginella moellendorffii TaxID=88036 RepID=D8SF14_SELML|nr:hypothetical protein SELMODRAFT_179218 [Selaginella moellendorffii]